MVSKEVAINNEATKYQSTITSYDKEMGPHLASPLHFMFCTLNPNYASHSGSYS